jgi:hypothetical protein
VVYKLGPGEAYSTLYNFTGGAHGAYPIGKLLIDPATGNLYGATFGVGNTSPACPFNGCGLVFRVDPSTGG